MSRLEQNLGREPLVPLNDDDELASNHAEFLALINAKGGKITNNVRAFSHGDALALATRRFLDETWALGGLSKQFQSLIRYKVSTTNTCFYCSTHQIRHLTNNGVPQEKIDNIHDFETHPAFDDRERAALGFIDAMTRDASNIPDVVAKDFVDAFSPKERVEISIVATAMGMLNKMNDALRIPLEDEALDQALTVPEFKKGGKA
jgi:alkylhydroperoxidase family enzyme